MLAGRFTDGFDKEKNTTEFELGRSLLQRLLQEDRKKFPYFFSSTFLYTLHVLSKLVKYGKSAGKFVMNQVSFLSTGL